MKKFISIFVFIISFNNTVWAGGEQAEGIAPQVAPHFALIEKASLFPLYRNEISQTLINSDDVLQVLTQSPGSVYILRPRDVLLEKFMTDLKRSIRSLGVKLELKNEEVTIGWVIQLHQLYLALTEPAIFPYKAIVDIKENELVTAVKEKYQGEEDLDDTNSRMYKRYERDLKAAKAQAQSILAGFNQTARDHMKKMKAYSYVIDTATSESLEIDHSNKTVLIEFDENDFDSVLSKFMYKTLRSNGETQKVIQAFNSIIFLQWEMSEMSPKIKFKASESYGVFTNQTTYEYNFNKKKLTHVETMSEKKNMLDTDIVTASKIVEHLVNNY